jgi:hypothetical protein
LPRQRRRCRLQRLQRPFSSAKLTPASSMSAEETAIIEIGTTTVDTLITGRIIATPTIGRTPMADIPITADIPTGTTGGLGSASDLHSEAFG